MKRRDFLIGSSLFVTACASPLGGPPDTFRSNRISVNVEGSGPDVILVPGLTSSPEIWAGLVAAVPGYRYHLVQVAGFAGAPIGGNGGEGPILADLAQEIARYVTVAKLKAPAIIGHSMGGSLAMMVAARSPGLVSKVMVVDMLPFMGILFGPPGTTRQSVVPTAEMIRLQILARSEAERSRSIETTIATMVRSEAARAGPIRHALASDTGLGARAMYDLITTDLRPELGGIKQPMTVLYVRSPNTPLTDAQMDFVYRSSFANVPHAVLKRVPDAYHFIMLDQPGRFADEVRTFLAA